MDIDQMVEVLKRLEEKGNEFAAFAIFALCWESGDPAPEQEVHAIVQRLADKPDSDNQKRIRVETLLAYEKPSKREWGERFLFLFYQDLYECGIELEEADDIVTLIDEVIRFEQIH